MMIQKVYIGWDSNLDAWKNRLADRGVRQGEDISDGFKVTWTKQDFMDFTGWSGTTYSNLDKSQKASRLYNMGVTLHDLTGKGDTTTATVTIHNFAWFNLLLRGEAFRNEVAEAYLQELFTGNGYMELDGVFIAATIKEYAEKYGTMFGKTVSAAKNKLDRIRKPLNKNDYLLKGKRSPVKQIRVKQAGQETYLKGARAIYLNDTLRTEYVSFYDKLNERLPLYASDPRHVRNQKNRLRKEEAIDFTEHLKNKYKLSLIRCHHTAVISEKALSDYQAIITLYMLGTTFTEIRSFLDERPAYWKEEEKRQKTPGKSVGEILDEIIL